MDWIWYVVTAVVVFVVASFIYGIFDLKRSLREAWQELSEAFNGAREPRAMRISPKGAADRLDYGEAQFLGYFELTSDLLKFYWYKINDGAVIEIPVEWIRKASKVEGHHEPMAKLDIETPNGKKLTINASVPHRMCSRLTRLGGSAEVQAS